MTDTNEPIAMVSLTAAVYIEIAGKRRKYSCVSIYRGSSLNHVAAGGEVARLQMCGLRKKFYCLQRPKIERDSFSLPAGAKSGLARAHSSFLARLKLGQTVTQTTKMRFEMDTAKMTAFAARVQAVQDGKSNENYEQILEEVRGEALCLTQITANDAPNHDVTQPTFIDIMKSAGPRGFMVMCTALHVTPDNQLNKVASNLGTIVKEVEVERRQAAAAVRATHYKKDTHAGMF